MSARTAVRALVIAASFAGPAAWAAADAPAHGPTELDRQVEAFLAGATVIDDEAVGKGTTGARRLTLQSGETRARAIFRTVDQESQEAGVYDRLEMTFADRYVFEIAAYRLDRLLGIGLVPPTVARRIGDREGALQFWVEDAVDMNEGFEKGVTPRRRDVFLVRKGAMLVLDTLIYNIDRNFGNILITPGDDRLYLIDHTRAFRLDKALPPYITDWNLQLPPGLAARVAEITRADLDGVFKGLLSRAQVAAVEKRRQLLVRKLTDVGLLPGRR